MSDAWFFCERTIEDMRIGAQTTGTKGFSKAWLGEQCVPSPRRST